MLIRIVLALLTAVVGGAGGYLAYQALTNKPSAIVQETASQNPPKLDDTAKKPSQPDDKPAVQIREAKFDVVRVEPDGSLVVAGHIEANEPNKLASKVALLDSGKELDHVTPDSQGQFVFAGLTLPPGLHELALSLDQVMSAQRVSIVIGEKKAGQSKPQSAPLVALLSPGSPAQVLSQPDAAPSSVPSSVPNALPSAASDPAPISPQQAAPPSSSDTAPLSLALAIVSVEFAEAGSLTIIGKLEGLPASFSATKSPEWTVRLRAGDTVLGAAQFMPNEASPTKGSVHWQLTHAFAAPKTPITIFAEAVGKDNRVLARNQVIFSYQPALPASAEAAPLAASKLDTAAATKAASVSNSQIVVVKGDNLWRISRKLFGEGMRYTEIYEANKVQIKNPNLIYPEQKFLIQRKTVP